MCSMQLLRSNKLDQGCKNEVLLECFFRKFCINPVASISKLLMMKQGLFMKNYILSAVLLAMCASSHGATLIHVGRLIDGISDKPRLQATVVVEGDKVVAVESGYRQPVDGDHVVNWRDGTLMPGFIDMHTHLSGKGGKGSYMDPFSKTPADLAYRAAANAKATLKAGFTTVRDLGDSYNVTVSLRNAISNGLVEGPRIYTASKALSTTGGHGDPTNGHKHDLMGDPGPAQGVLNGPEDAYKAVRYS